MPEDVLGYLNSKNLGPIKQAGPNDVHLSCFFCNEPEGKRGRLYVNTDPNADIPGLWFCHLCGAKGSLVTIKKHFGDPISVKEDNDWVRRDILQKAAAYYVDCLADHPEVLGYLKHERGLTIDTIIDHQLGWADGKLRGYLEDEGFKLQDIKATGLVSDSGHDFLRDKISIPYHVAKTVVMIRGKEIGGKYLTPHGQKTRLYNSDVLWDAERVCAAEGEFDCLILEQYGHAAVGVPGANTWQDSWDGYFTHTRRLYLVFDPDEAGRRGADKIRQRLTPRVRVVELPVPEGIDAGAVDVSWMAVTGDLTAKGFEELLSKAKGSDLKTVDDIAADFHSIDASAGMSFDVEDLDAVLKPGLLPTQVMIVLARSGVGKTVFVLNTMQRMAKTQPHLRFLFASLELTGGQCWDRMIRMHRFYNLDSTENDAKDFWRPRLLTVDSNRMDEETLVAYIDQYEFETGAKPHILVVDYLGYWAQAFKGESYEKTSNAIRSLKAIAKEKGIAIIAPHQVSRGAELGCEPSPDNARDSGVILETADFLLTLWNPDEKLGTLPGDKHNYIHCRIAKSRHGGAGTTFRYQFAPLTLALVPLEDPLYPQAAREFEWRNEENILAEAGGHPVRMTWEEAIERHHEVKSIAAVSTHEYEEF